MSANNSHAFKEWAAIVAALGSGAQTIILRKGGIAEGRGGFDPARATRFWLYPTSFHTQREKLKPAAAPFLDNINTSSTSSGKFEYFADLAAHRFLTDWHEILSLDPFHLWTEAAVRERFEWSKPAGLHLLVVRVHRLLRPLAFPAGVDLGGCKSWIELPLELDSSSLTSSPVLSDTEFAAMSGHLPV